jgi:hypothetical protein
MDSVQSSVHFTLDILCEVMKTPSPNQRPMVRERTGWVVRRVTGRRGERKAAARLTTSPRGAGGRGTARLAIIEYP